MKTTIEHLLSPRFKVIADYPGSEFQLGITIEYGSYPEGEQGEKCLFVTLPELPLKEVWPNPSVFHEFEKYPRIFFPLSWWEDRKMEEMPKYLKSDRSIATEGLDQGFEYYKVDKWILPKSFGPVAIIEGTKTILDHPIFPREDLFPCSEEEFLANVKP